MANNTASSTHSLHANVPLDPDVPEPTPTPRPKVAISEPPHDSYSYASWEALGVLTFIAGCALTYKYRGPLADMATFAGSTVKNYRQTGALFPSGPFLTREITKGIGTLPPNASILDVGAGTGVFSDAIIRQLRDGDHITILELNETLVQILKNRLAEDPIWMKKASQISIVQGDAATFRTEKKFNRIVCGLPFSSLKNDLTHAIFQNLFINQLEPGYEFRYFQYVGSTTVRRTIDSAKELATKGITYFGQTPAQERTNVYAVRISPIIWRNASPARVITLRRPENGSATRIS